MLDTLLPLRQGSSCLNIEGEAFKIHTGRAAVIPAGSSSDSGCGLIWRKGEGKSATEISLCQGMCAVGALSEEEPGDGEGCTGSQAGWVCPHGATCAALPVTILQEDEPMDITLEQMQARGKETSLLLWATG